MAIQKKLNLIVDLGRTYGSYLQFTTHSARAWIRQLASPPAAEGRSFFAPWQPPSHLQVPQGHFRLLDQYDSVAKYFIPTDERLLRPTFTLLKSDQGNIFLSRKALERDAVDPEFIERARPNHGQAEEEFLKEKAYLFKAYHALYKETGLDIVWASALSFEEGYSVAQKLPHAAQSCWNGGHVRLKQLLICTAAKWENIVGPGVPCPLGPELFLREVVAQAEEDARVRMEMESAFEGLGMAVGVDKDGWVRNEDYERTVRVNEALREDWVESLGEEQKQRLGGINPVWPFQGQADAVPAHIISRPALARF